MSAGLKSESLVRELFILHAQADMEFVDRELLPFLGLPPHLVELSSRLPLGQPLVLAAERALATSRATLLILSPAFLEEEQVRLGELLATYQSTEEERPVIPVKVRPCNLPLRLRMRNTLDLCDPRYRTEQMQRLRDLFPSIRREQAVVEIPHKRGFLSWLTGSRTRS